MLKETSRSMRRVAWLIRLGWAPLWKRRHIWGRSVIWLQRRNLQTLPGHAGTVFGNLKRSWRWALQGTSKSSRRAILASLVVKGWTRAMWTRSWMSDSRLKYWAILLLLSSAGWSLWPLSDRFWSSPWYGTSQAGNLFKFRVQKPRLSSLQELLRSLAIPYIFMILYILPIIVTFKTEGWQSFSFHSRQQSLLKQATEWNTSEKHSLPSLLSAK